MSCAHKTAENDGKGDFREVHDVETCLSEDEFGEGYGASEHEYCGSFIQKITQRFELRDLTPPFLKTTLKNM